MYRIVRAFAIVLLAAAIGGADHRPIHPEIRREIKAFAVLMARQMANNEDNEWGWDRLNREYSLLKYEFDNRNDADTIAYLSVRLANASMMFQHYRTKK